MGLGSWQVEALSGHFCLATVICLVPSHRPVRASSFRFAFGIRGILCTWGPFGGAFGFPGAPGACASEFATAPLALPAAFRSRSSFSLSVSSFCPH